MAPKNGKQVPLWIENTAVFVSARKFPQILNHLPNSEGICPTKCYRPMEVQIRRKQIDQIEKSKISSKPSEELCLVK